MAKGTKWREFEIGRKSKSKKFNLEKISMQMMRDGKAGGVKFYLYNRQGNISMAWGDMAVSLISMKEEFDSTTIAVEVDEAIKSKTADAGMECQECGKKFRAKLSTLEYGRTKCPQCKSTDIDFAFGEGLEEARRMPKNVRDYMKFAKGQGPNPDQVLDVKDVDKWVKEIKKGIKAGWVSVGKSALGGDKNVAIMIKLTLEPEKEWPNKILQNARFGMLRIATDGTMEMFASHRNLKNMRRTKVKSAKDVVNKINTWIKAVSEERIKVSFGKYLEEGRPAIADPDARRPGDEEKARRVAAQQKKYKPEEVANIARKHKVRMDGDPISGNGDWLIAVRGGITLDSSFVISIIVIKCYSTSDSN
jgi:phage FluMu protein Com